jgi:hypothetical protein
MLNTGLITKSNTLLQMQCFFSYFFHIENLAKFLKKKEKLVELTSRNFFPKSFPISLAKNSEISPKTKPMVLQLQVQHFCIK